MMCSINEAVAETGASYHFIRSLCDESKIAYVLSGKKYLINMNSLCNYLELANGNPVKLATPIPV